MIIVCGLTNLSWAPSVCAH